MQIIKTIGVILTVSLGFLAIRRLAQGENTLLIMGQCFFPVVFCGAMVFDRAFLGFVSSACGFAFIVGEFIFKEQRESIEIYIQIFLSAPLNLISTYLLSTRPKEKEEKNELFHEPFSSMWV
jgi:hypothetical protein